MTIASILSDLWRGGGAFEAPPQAQELQKSPGGIGLKKSHIPSISSTSSSQATLINVTECGIVLQPYKTK